jgi:hypothetical protein
MAQRDASSTTMRRNGVAAVLSNQNIVHAGTTYSYMGQGNSSGAYFMETLIFPLLSAADSERVETYLRNKWNIPSIVEDDFSGLGVLNGSYPPIRHAGNPWLNLDGLPSSQNRVGGYAQLDTQPTAYRATIDCGASDGTLEMTFKHSSSGGSNTIVIWRVSDSINFFQAHILASTVAIYRVVGNAATAIGSFSGLVADTWHTVKVVLDGSNHKVYLNGVLAMNVTDTFNQTVKKHGIGGNASGTGITYFDNFKFTPK